MEAVFFGEMESFFSCLSEKYGPDAREQLLSGRGQDLFMDVTYYPGVNEYMGKKTLQITIWIIGNTVKREGYGQVIRKWILALLYTF